ncbi:MAG: hypothetical protein NC930_04845 [Candidatus Omnitrophica bacterium]|nr:hypothetical protein [Candidatus Omnitrophota bacterium]
MKKMLLVSCLLMVSMPLVFGNATLLAKGKDDGKTPAGWSKGEKKGWLGKLVPPGLSKDKALRDSEKEAKRKEKAAEKEAEKLRRQQKREAKKAAEKAKEDAQKEKEEAEKVVTQQ